MDTLRARLVLVLVAMMVISLLPKSTFLQRSLNISPHRGIERGDHEGAQVRVLPGSFSL
jgi:hypothetical protein